MIEYVLTDGNGLYIQLDKCSKKYVPIRSKKQATRWAKREVAENILTNSVSKALRDRLMVKPVEVVTTAVIRPPEKKKTISNEQKESFPIKKERNISNTLDRLRKENVGVSRINTWAEELKRFAGTMSDLEERQSALIRMLSNVDSEICDIQHYIEFNNMNCCEGYKLSKILQIRLRNRRRIKDELSALSFLMEVKIDSEGIDKAQRRIAGLVQRQYTPRILKELFQ